MKPMEWGRSSRRMLASFRARIDHFTAFRKRIGHIPIRNRKLALHAVSDVRIEPDGILLWNLLSQRGQIHRILWAIDNAGKPGGAAADQAEELIHPCGVKALRRSPHLRFGMVLAQVSGLLFEQGE